MKNSKIILAFACAFSTFYTFSQGTNWRIAGNNNITGGTNFLGTTNAQPIEFRTSNVERMRITSNGFVGLNNSVPNFHLDIITPERPGGELLFRTRVSGDEVASMNIINIAGASNTFFVPALFGLQSNTVAGSAFNTIGSIDSVQDLSNLPPISRFFSARDYNPALNNYSLDRVNVIKNRPLFQWLNGTDGLMIMNANGFVGLTTATPGNRLEINSDYYNTTTENVIIPGSASDTTFATDNGFGGTGYSGLRFTNLRSTSTPQTTNPGQGVLALDENGDVIYVSSSTKELELLKKNLKS